MSRGVNIFVPPMHRRRKRLWFGAPTRGKRPRRRHLIARRPVGAVRSGSRGKMEQLLLLRRRSRLFAGATVSSGAAASPRSTWPLRSHRWRKRRTSSEPRRRSRRAASEDGATQGDAGAAAAPAAAAPAAAAPALRPLPAPALAAAATAHIPCEACNITSGHRLGHPPAVILSSKLAYRRRRGRMSKAWWHGNHDQQKGDGSDATLLRHLESAPPKPPGASPLCAAS